MLSVNNTENIFLSGMVYLTTKLPTSIKIASKHQNQNCQHALALLANATSSQYESLALMNVPLPSIASHRCRSRQAAELPRRAKQSRRRLSTPPDNTPLLPLPVPRRSPASPPPPHARTSPPHRSATSDAGCRRRGRDGPGTGPGALWEKCPGQTRKPHATETLQWR